MPTREPAPVASHVFPVVVRLVEEAYVAKVEEAMAQLTADERLVIKARTGADGGAPLHYGEIASQLKVTRERVRELEKTAKARLQELLLPERQEMEKLLTNRRSNPKGGR